MNLEEKNRAATKRMYELIFSGKLEQATEEFIGDECVLHEAEPLPYAGHYRGKAGYLEIGRKFYSTWEDVISKHITYAAGGDYVMARFFVTAKHRKTGRQFSMPFIEEFRFKDGKAIEIYVFYYEAKLAAWAAGVE